MNLQDKRIRACRKAQSIKKLENSGKEPEPISDILARVMANLQRKKEVASHE